MPVAIHEINIKNLGPIPEIDWKLGKLNLVYGKNETGKTLLVEFLIRSLFKSKEWQLRPQTGTGRITISGIEEDLLSFSPSSLKKFEEYYATVIGGLPPDFSKLLVVKGADVELSREKEADKIFIKRYLSSKELLDTIEDSISKTIQTATIENGQIYGQKKGEIKRRNELKQNLDRINNLFDTINKEYLSGEKQLLENKKSKLEQKLEEMKKAKRHCAYTLAKEIQELEMKRNEVDDIILDEINNQLNILEQKEDELRTKHQNYRDAKERSKDFPWVKESAELYKGFLSSVDSRKFNNNLLFSLIIILGVLTTVFSYFNIFIGVTASLITLIVIVFLSIRGYRNLARESRKMSELEKISKEYEKRFGTPLSGLPELINKQEELKIDFNNSDLLFQQWKGLENEVKQLKIQLSLTLQQIFGEKIDEEKWGETLHQVREDKRRATNRIMELNAELSRLNVDETEYLEKPPSIEYDPEEYTQIETDLHKVLAELQDNEIALTNLKQEICRYTNDDIGTSWETLIENLRKEHEEIINELREITAEIIGKIAVMDIINKLREEEDEKIKEGLKNENISKPLYEVTKRYIGFKLEGDTLYVQDPYTEFKLSEISTGAREQVLLALRMGFCSRLLREERLFFILDDAFQYSDWDRRERLVDKIVELARNGWQIIYFTMDDNIRELFNRKGEALGTDYKNFILAET